MRKIIAKEKKKVMEVSLDEDSEGTHTRTVNGYIS